jgi:hypothetical protein
VKRPSAVRADVQVCRTSAVGNEKAGGDVPQQVGGWDDVSIWRSVAMPTTTNECQHKAELCLWLASKTKEIYAKTALLELAKEFRALAEPSEPARVIIED